MSFTLNIPASVHGARESSLGLRVERAFVDPVAVEKLKRKAYENVRMHLHKLPDDLRVVDSGEFDLLQDLDWLAKMLCRMFPARKLARISEAEVFSLVRALVSGDVSSYTKAVAKGPGLASLAVLVSGGTLLSPLERALAAHWMGILSSGLPMLLGAGAQPSFHGVGNLPFSLQMSLAQGLRQLKSMGEAGVSSIRKDYP